MLLRAQPPRELGQFPLTAGIISQIHTIAQINTAMHTDLLMPAPAVLCCCASSACPAPELQAGCLCLSLLHGILLCSCLVSLPALLLLSLQVQGEITVPCTLGLCSYLSRADSGRSCSAGTSHFGASLPGLQEWARAGRDKQHWYVWARQTPVLCFSGSFVSVVRFSQAEFLTEISLFSPFPKEKGLISPKDFSSPVLTLPALLCCGTSLCQQLCAIAICSGKTEPLLIYFVPDA